MVGPYTLANAHFVSVIPAVWCNGGNLRSIESIKKDVDIGHRATVESIIIDYSSPGTLNLGVPGDKFGVSVLAKPNTAC